ncbi:MAG: glycosyltransferase family 4 protein, partial [bacterium]|nr:glycosyltransferase family 4 protein [bacterium]
QPELLRHPGAHRADVFHYPHYNLPWVNSRRCVVNVFDLFHLRYGSLLRRRYQAFFLWRLRWSRAIILTSSAKTRREIEDIAQIGRDRVIEVPLGAGRPIPREDVRPPALQSLAATPLRPPWLLAIGIDQPHKNVDFLISALGLYFQRRPEAPPLVWLGLSEADCERRGRQLPAFLRPRIALEPYAPPERAEAIMRGAGALVFPSLDEGFGLPPLEAMARGTPVLCARREPMTAILGDAPLYFEPTESASLWRMLDRLLDMPAAVRADIIDRGRRQAARYRWAATARETFNVYARLAERSDLLVG